MHMRIDGGPQFRSHFKEFCKERNIKPDPSSPMHPESNGHSEATVKAVKHLYKKEGGNPEDTFCFKTEGATHTTQCLQTGQGDTLPLILNNWI